MAICREYIEGIWEGEMEKEGDMVRGYGERNWGMSRRGGKGRGYGGRREGGG